MRNDDFINAMRNFAAAVKLKEDDPYLIQQYALTTYKSKAPTAAEALYKAKEIIHSLKPESTQDCETLGIAAAIHKRLWLINRKESDLTLATDYYKRGFELSDNFHCGENYALCLNLKATIQKDINLLNFFNKQAKMVREDLMGILDKITASPDFSSRADKKWVLATLANTLFALGRTEEGHFYEGLLFMEKDVVFTQWERDVYETEKLQLMKMLNSKSSKNYRSLQ